MGNKKTKKDIFTKPPNSRWEIPSEEYIFSDEPVAVKELAKKWKAAHGTMLSQAKDEKWTKKRTQYLLDVERKIAKKESDKRANEVVKLRESFKQRWQVLMSQLDGLTFEKDGKGKISKIDGQPILKQMEADDLTHAARTLKICQEKLSEIIGVDLSRFIEEDENEAEFTFVFSYGAKDTYRSKI